MITAKTDQNTKNQPNRTTIRRAISRKNRATRNVYLPGCTLPLRLRRRSAPPPCRAEAEAVTSRHKNLRHAVVPLRQYTSNCRARVSAGEEKKEQPPKKVHEPRCSIVWRLYTRGSRNNPEIGGSFTSGTRASSLAILGPSGDCIGLRDAAWRDDGVTMSRRQFPALAGSPRPANGGEQSTLGSVLSGGNAF